ncbi:MAG: hypothetical protein AAF682_10305 [Planctomycetota bacterium]
MTSHPASHHVAIRERLGEALGRSSSFRSLPPAEQEDIRRNTEEILQFVAADPQDALDPYSSVLASTTTTRGPDGTTQSGTIGEGVRAGVAAAGQMVQEVDFPAFVRELIQGVFQSVVDATIQQMQAYAELVQSVAMSLNEFRDQNVSENQARDHLVSKYPSLMQINFDDGSPKVKPRDGAGFGDLPNFAGDFGLDEEVDSLDEETIEQVLVPAARNDLAARRQKLLSTMVLMGLNRIVVTDGRINAKVRFNFAASDQLARQTTAVDYENLGTTVVRQGTRESGSTGGGFEVKSGTLTRTNADRWSKGDYQHVERPVIKIASQTDEQLQSNLQAMGQLMGEVRLNFKSETLPLERLVDNDQVVRLNESNGAGRGVPAAAPGTTPATPAPAAPAAPAPGA